MKILTRFKSVYYLYLDMEELSNLCDDDIIPATPQKVFKKILRKKTSKTCIRHLQPKLAKSNLQVEEPTVGSYDFNKPFVYHTLHEVSNQDEKLSTRNNSILIVGIFFIDGDGRYSLHDSLDVQSNKIELDFTIVETIPNHHQALSVYGCLETRGILPIVIVQFYRNERVATINKYKENLISLRKFIPNMYL